MRRSSSRPRAGTAWRSITWRRPTAGSDGDCVARAEILLRLGTAQRRAGIATFRGSLLEASRIARDEGLVDLLVQATLTNLEARTPTRTGSTTTASRCCRRHWR